MYFNSVCLCVFDIHIKAGTIPVDVVTQATGVLASIRLNHKSTAKQVSSHVDGRLPVLGAG